MKFIEDFLNSIINRSPFYQKKFAGVGILNQNKITVSFDKIPFTNKKELLDDQLYYSPYGSFLAVQEEKICRIHKTSGTTDRPLIIALTEKDIEYNVSVGAKCFRSSGISYKDTVIHCLNYNMWAGGYTDHQSIEKTGAAVIPFGVGNSRMLIEIIQLLKPTAIHCTPSYLKKLELILKDDFNLSPRSLNLKIGLFGGESGIQNPNFRKKIEDTWGLKAMNANYGMSDVLSMFGAECIYQQGLHFFGEGYLYAELINNKTNLNVQVESGAIGELVLTSLKKEAQPLIRYRTNDVIKILSIERCICGETGFRFEVLGRSDDMLVIKGINVFVSSIDKVINDNLDSLTGLYQICINAIPPVDRLLIKLELQNNGNIYNENLLNKIIEDFRKNISIKPEIELLIEGTIERVEGKAKKVYKIL